jgi:ribosome-binding protein aMBF1 (putative translation factor)
MLRSDASYHETQRLLQDLDALLAASRAEYESQALAADDVDRLLQPLVIKRAALAEALEGYERTRRREFPVIYDLNDLGRMLIAARVASGLTQRELAARLGVSETQVSRDERFVYRAVSVTRAQRILDVLGERVRVSLEREATAGTGDATPGLPEAPVSRL